MSDATTEPTTTTGPSTAETDAQATHVAAQIGQNTAAAGLAAKITQLPAGVKLSSNLDTYENEKPAEAFWFQHGEAFFHLLAPDDVDFDDIVIVQEHPRLMMHILLDPAQRSGFEETKKVVPMKVGKMKKLIGDYTKHFGLTDLGELGGSVRP
jgi:hypothetical protein